MNRRQLIRWGSCLGALAGLGSAGRYLLLPPAPSQDLAPVDELAERLMAALSPEQRAQACVDYEHPLRQYHNRGVEGGGLPIRPWNLSWEARAILTDLFHAGLSADGRQRVPREFFLRWPGVHLMSLLVCGDPAAGPWQIVLSGPHLNLRLGGTSREGVAFGGPQVYGDQHGNGRPGLPGNLFRFQLERAAQLFEGLSTTERAAVRQVRAPIQTRIELQGRAGSFAGVRVGELPPGSRQRARQLVDALLCTWPAEDVDYAHACLEHNGGVEALAFSDYEQDWQGGRRAGPGLSQVFRLEGPAAVLYFRGEPHLHAFVNIAWDGEQALSVGEPLGSNPVSREGSALAALFERAMAEQAGTDLAYFPLESAVGHLRAGPLRSGDVYTAESWQDVLTVVEVRGAALAETLQQRLASAGLALQDEQLYSVATSGYAATELAAERLGRLSSRRPGRLLREVVVEHLKQHGFPAAG